MTFGYGKVICPECYGGEQPFIFFDDRFWLNRVMMKLFSGGEPRSKPLYEDSALDHIAYVEPEIEVVS